MWISAGADDTEIQLIGGIFARCQGGRRELFRAAIPPQKCRGIQQQPHGVPLRQKLSGSGASKSGRIRIFPGVGRRPVFAGLVEEARV